MTDKKRLGRRDFVELLGAGTLASGVLWVPGCGDSGSRGNGGSGGGAGIADRVIVIGAGGAGLTIGNALTTAGVDNVVLEARDRIGGRVYTRDIGSVPVDMGAAWLHGPNGNPAACIMNHEGLGWTSAEQFDAGVRGYDAVLGEFLDLGDLLNAANTLTDFEAALPALRETLGSDATYAAAIALFLSQSGLTGEERRYAEFVLHVPNELNLSESTDLVSITPNPSVALPGGDHFPDGSYRGLINALGRGVNVRLDTVVNRIEYTADGVTVETSNGAEQGSHVVVTVPVGVLKAGGIEFSPPLPDAKQGAIERLDMGSLEKVALRYDSAFWPDPEAGNFLYVSEQAGEFPLIVDYTAYAGGAPTLVTLYCGDFGRSAANMSDDAIAGRFAEVVEEIAGAPGPSPIEAVVTHWKSDPFALGSYVYLPTGATTADIEALGVPVGDRLFFAGEATSVAYNGYLHGAILSGIRESERLLGRQGQGVELESGLVVGLGCDETA